MITAMFNKMSLSISRTGSDRNGSLRNSRVNRRYSFSLGIEGLEGRLAPSGGIAPITVTVTNQGDTSTDTSTDTTTTGQDDGTPIVTYGAQSAAVFTI